MDTGAVAAINRAEDFDLVEAPTLCLEFHSGSDASLTDVLGIELKSLVHLSTASYKTRSPYEKSEGVVCNRFCL